MHLPQRQRATRSEESRRRRGAREAPASSPPSRSPHPKILVSDKNIFSDYIIDMNFLDSEKFEIANLIRGMK